MTRVAVAPNKFAKGFDGTGRKTPFAYEVLDLQEALMRTYSTDAHLVTYVVEGVTRQPRINKPGLAHFDGKVTVGAFFCDIDNPLHAAWDPAALKAAIEQYDSLEILKTAGVYHTAHGRRIVQPLADPVPAQDVEPYLRRWLLQLEKAGLPVDWACRDWTRHFRLPSVYRNGHAYRCPLLRLDQMQPINLEPLLASEQARPAASGPTPELIPVPMIDWTKDLPEVWRPCVAPLAKAVLGVSSEWHQLFLALAGAFLSRSVPREHVPALCRAVSAATGADTRTDDREASARTTVQRRLAGLPTTGYGTLAANWPAVADAFDNALARGNEAHLRALGAAEPAVPPKTLAESTAALEQAILTAPDGLTLISAECGLGKTQAAMRVAAQRAAKPYATPDAKGVRAPPQSKTAISVDKNSLALQIADGMAKTATKVRRVFGPLSVKDEQGRPVCRWYDVARPLVAGGQAMQWELCRGRDLDPCEFSAGCPAKDGVEGPDNARVTVGPHALIGVLDAAAGTTGLLIVDEPPALLETVMVTLEDLATTRRLLDAFDERFAAAMKPALSALRAWLEEHGPVDVLTTIQAALRSCPDAIDAVSLDQAQFATSVEGDAVDLVVAAQEPEREGRPPPMKFVSVHAARRNTDYAEQLGGASRVLGAIYRAVRSTIPVAVRIEERPVFGRVLLLTFAREQLARALQRDGAVVVTDANAELHAPVLAKVVGYQPRLLRFSAVDGAPIARTLLRCASATRKGWLRQGKLVLDGGLVTALREAGDWVREAQGVAKTGLITMRVVELAIAAALRPVDKSVDQEWKKLRQEPATLDQARAKLGPILRAWPGELVLAHYGAVRGLNNMADVDCLVTLGDPWANLGEVRNDVAFLGLLEAWEGRLTDLCRAELEQAHGRLRAVHRKRPGRALHVGNVLPSGAGWSSGNVEFRRLEGGRPANRSTSTPSDVRGLLDAVGGPQIAAGRVGCSSRALRNYSRGTRRMPSALEAQLRLLVLQSHNITHSGVKRNETPY